MCRRVFPWNRWMLCLKMLEWTCLSIEQVLDKCGIAQQDGQPAVF